LGKSAVAAALEFFNSLLVEACRKFRVKGFMLRIKEISHGLTQSPFHPARLMACEEVADFLRIEKDTLVKWRETGPRGKAALSFLKTTRREAPQGPAVREARPQGNPLPLR
jgi:hypothetical protein